MTSMVVLASCSMLTLKWLKESSSSLRLPQIEKTPTSSGIRIFACVSHFPISFPTVTMQSGLLARNHFRKDARFQFLPSTYT